MLRSGSTLKAEQAFGAGLANSDFSHYFDRLQKMSGVGQSSAAGQGAGSLSSADQISKSDTALGAQQAFIYGNLASGIGGAANSYLNNSLYQDRTNAIGGGGGGGFVDFGEWTI